MTVTLTLGGVVFADFEIPDSISSGGEQMLTVHKLPGGNRIIDALGHALLLALQTSINTAQTVTQSAIAAASSQVLANPLPAAGVTPATAAEALSNQSSAMTQLYQLCQLSGVLGRMGVNAENAGS
jgi:hypothetical protein